MRHDEQQKKTLSDKQVSSEEKNSRYNTTLDKN